jgi:hypothetical protein
MHATAEDEMTFLLESHGFHHLIDVVGTQLLGRTPKAVAAECDYSDSDNTNSISHLLTF